MKLRDKAIISYGTKEDRLMLAALAKASEISGSEYVIGMIRSNYKLVYGDDIPVDHMRHK